MAPKRTRRNPIDEALLRDASLASTHGREGGHAENVVGALSLPMFFLNYLKKVEFSLMELAKGLLD